MHSPPTLATVSHLSSSCLSNHLVVSSRQPSPLVGDKNILDKVKTFSAAPQDQQKDGPLSRKTAERWSLTGDFWSVILVTSVSHSLFCFLVFLNTREAAALSNLIFFFQNDLQPCSFLDYWFLDLCSPIVLHWNPSFVRPHLTELRLSLQHATHELTHSRTHTLTNSHTHELTREALARSA